MLVMNVLLANPRGFCAGVDRAIAIVEQALAQFGAPIYVRHEVVHNKFVVDDLKAKGAIFVEELDESPGRQHRRVLRARRVEGGARRGRGARAARVRRDVPAGDQGARRGRQDARAGARDRDDRPRRASRGRGHDGPVRRRHLPRRVGRPTSRGSRSRTRAPRLRDADDAVGRRRRGDRRRAEGALSGDRRPEEGRHLLRDAEPAGRRQVHGAGRSTS